jgi:hypothetical protein
MCKKKSSSSSKEKLLRKIKKERSRKRSKKYEREIASNKRKICIGKRKRHYEEVLYWELISLCVFQKSI